MGGFYRMVSPVARSQAVTVLASSIATVTGPTPPGTGVMALAMGGDDLFNTRTFYP